MHRLRRHLPSLTALLAFDAAARAGSFTRAAMELGVTQAAVSRQIQAVEADLGFPLFRRQHRRIELTERGRVLAAAVAQGFTHIAEAAEALTRDSPRDELAIGATLAVSHFWLLPRISEFRARHPGFKLRILTQDTSFDLQRDPVDAVFRYGAGTWADGSGTRLFGDEVAPVASQAFLAGNGTPRTIEELAAAPLIAFEVADPSWLGWDEFMRAFDCHIERRNVALRCNSYVDAISAALAGQGIAFGWTRLIEDLLDRRQLVRVTDKRLPVPYSYFLLLSARGRTSDAAQAFLAWVRETAAEATRRTEPSA